MPHTAPRWAAGAIAYILVLAILLGAFAVLGIGLYRRQPPATAQEGGS